MENERHSQKEIMLIGEYEHTLDEKNRVSLPKKFRAALGKKIVITRGLDNCLFMYGAASWKRVMEKLDELSFAQADKRGFSRFILSGAAELDVDGAGRILVPEHQRVFAKLSKEVVFAGVSDRVEVWDKKAWSDYKAAIESKADTLAENLGQIGAL